MPDTDAIDTAQPDSPSPNWGKRFLIACLAIVLILAIILSALRLFIASDSGARFIENQLNTRSLGPIERVEVSGLDGDVLTDFQIKNIKIYDKTGLWSEAKNISLKWTAWDLLKKDINIKQLLIEDVNVLRRPVLNTSENSGGSPAYRFTLREGRLDSLRLAENIMGRTTLLGAEGQLETFKNGSVLAKIKAQELETGRDTVSLDFKRNISGEMQGDFKLEGASEGLLSTILRAPEADMIQGNGRLTGDPDIGTGDLTLSFGDQKVIEAKASWEKQNVRLDGQVITNNWSIFDKLRQGLGNTLDISLEARRDAQSPDFKVNLQSNRLSLTANGQHENALKLPTRFDLNGTTDNLSALLPLPENYKAGAASFEGRVNLDGLSALEGNVSLRGINTPYAKIGRITGPIRLTESESQIYSLESDFQIRDLAPKIENPLVLTNQSNLKLATQIDMKARLAQNIKLGFSSGNNMATLLGRASLDGEAFDLSGAIKTDVQPYKNLPSGNLQSEYKLQKTITSLPALSANGAFRPTSDIPLPFETSLSEGLNFDVNMSPIENGVRLKNVSLRSENIILAAEGDISNILDLKGEVLIDQPIAYEGYSLSGATEASITVTGERANPSLKIDARADQINTPQTTLNDARLRTDLKDVISSPKGPVRFSADTPYGALDTELIFTSTPSQYIAESIVLRLDAFAVEGQLALSQNGLIDGTLKAVLPETNAQYANILLELNSIAQEQALELTLDAQNIAYKNINIDKADAVLAGSLAKLEGKISLTGAQKQDIVEREITFNTNLSVSRETNNLFKLSVLPKARYGPITLDAETPITTQYQDGDISLQADVILANAPLSIRYDLEADAETLTAEAQNVSLQDLPLPQSLRQTIGDFSGQIELSRRAQSGVRGTVQTTLTDWRGADAKKDTSLDATVEIDINNTQADWQINVQDKSDFVTQGQGRINMQSADKIANIRPDMDAAMTGDLTASGSLRSVLALFTPDDARPKGILEASLSLAGTPKSPQIQGQAQGRSIQLEAPQLGTRLSDGRFKLDFSNQGFSVEDVFISDSKGGTLIGDGEFTLGEFGRPLGNVSLEADDFRALNRRDFESRVSGALGYESTAERSRINGDILLARTEVKQFVTGGASVVEIPVTEINTPKNLQSETPAAPALPIDLDIKVKAPRRVFIRSRGLDVELSVDATLKGTLDAPDIVGEANVLRGGYKLAGKELAFNSGRIIFNGPLNTARVDLVARTETPTLSAEINITGTVETPEIELSSTPERPQDEILSALLFGRSVTELSTLEAAQLAGALAQFSGAGGGFDLMGGLRDALGVSQLSIGVGNDGAAQITGGRYLAKNVYLQIFSGADTSQTGAVIDWEIRRNISLRSRIQADNDQNFSLKWKKDF